MLAVGFKAALFSTQLWWRQLPRWLIACYWCFICCRRVVYLL